MMPGPASAVEEHPPINPAIQVRTEVRDFLCAIINLHIGTTLILQKYSSRSDMPSNVEKADLHSLHYVKGDVAR